MWRVFLRRRNARNNPKRKGSFPERTGDEPFYVRAVISDRRAVSTDLQWVLRPPEPLPCRRRGTAQRRIWNCRFLPCGSCRRCSRGSVPATALPQHLSHRGTRRLPASVPHRPVPWHVRRTELPAGTAEPMPLRLRSGGRAACHFRCRHRKL